jgi:hypothetical protein
MGALLTTPPLEYDKAYGCQVFWKEADVLGYLETMMA